ncbi:MAG: hypothetical protein ABIZ52_03010 [Candidatus Limnocylindrales bacterium]
MSTRAKRTKRTYNLAAPTVHRVRELAELYGTSPTQDGVVDLAVERLYLEVRERAESDRWAASTADPEFQRERREIQRDLRHAESWPE